MHVLQLCINIIQNNGNWIIKGWFEIIPPVLQEKKSECLLFYYYVECADCDAKLGDGSGMAMFLLMEKLLLFMTLGK